MKKINITILSSILLFLMGCVNVELPPLNPDIAVLISPFNNETCLDGISINDTQSEVTFEWTQSLDAFSYEIVIKNLFSLEEKTYTETSNKISLILSKAEPYEWFVRSIGEEGSVPSESEKWKFYLAGNLIINYAPFPAELITPRSGSNVTPNINNLVSLNWTASDVDNDLVRFEIYLDNTDATELKTKLEFQEEENSIEVIVENNKTYYWRIVSIDSNDNESSSGVYAFRTN